MGGEDQEQRVGQINEEKDNKMLKEKSEVRLLLEWSGSNKHTPTHTHPQTHSLKHTLTYLLAVA